MRLCRQNLKNIIILFIVLLLVINGCIQQGETVTRKPIPKKITSQKPFYEDDMVLIYQKDQQTNVINKKTGQKIIAGFSGSVEKISNKSEDHTPLAGVVIKEGIKITSDTKIQILEIEPQFRVLAVYPNPGTGSDKIIINKGDNTLYFYKKGELYKTYAVATGKDPQYTPEGKFKITNKIVDHGRELKPQLGNRWMGLSVPFEKDNRAENDPRAPEGSKYGIHGTDEPDSIGKYASGGCIRMDNQQVVELFELVEVDIPVEITGNIVR